MQHGLSSQDAQDIWHAATGVPKFDTKADQREFNSTVKWSKKLGYEPEGLKRPIYPVVDQNKKK